jgi:glycosyltransferase involved in cell wall biosynthesis
MTSNPPSVSVVIPCYNAVHFVTEALESVFSQTYTDYEVLVVNDGSPETELLESLLLPYRSRIRYLRQANGGPAAARNTGIRGASGTYVAFLDSDDAWMPSFLAEHLQVLEADPTLAMVAGNAVFFGNTGRGGKTRNRTLSSMDVTFEALFQSLCVIIPSCVVARRDVLLEVGLFDESLIYDEDVDLWVRMTCHGARIQYRPAVLTRRRVHARSLTAEVDRTVQGQLDMRTKLLRTLPDLPAHQRAVLENSVAGRTARLHFIYGAEHLLAGRPAEARAALGMANSLRPSLKLQAVIAALRIAPRLVCRIWRIYLSRRPSLERFRMWSEQRPDAAETKVPIPPGPVQEASAETCMSGGDGSR